jgi:Leucine-rich repeat (LRR) protein
MKKLPPSLGDLTCLLKLNVENNQINQLPPQIGNLTGAQFTWLYWYKSTDNNAEDAASQRSASCGSTTTRSAYLLYWYKRTNTDGHVHAALRELWLNDNALTQLPPVIGLLKDLRELRLSNNQVLSLLALLAQKANTDAETAIPAASCPPQRDLQPRRAQAGT